jgi:hypothetical protein
MEFERLGKETDDLKVRIYLDSDMTKGKVCKITRRKPTGNHLL